MDYCDEAGSFSTILCIPGMEKRKVRKRRRREVGAVDLVFSVGVPGPRLMCPISVLQVL